jgi:hypothetical protein
MNLDGLVEKVLCAGIEGALHGLHLLLDISKQILQKISFYIQFPMVCKYFFIIINNVLLFQAPQWLSFSKHFSDGEFTR